jgi:hypothetical protein
LGLRCGDVRPAGWAAGAPDHGGATLVDGERWAAAHRGLPDPDRLSSVGASEFNQSAGDFFTALGSGQLLIVVFSILAVCLATASRVVGRDDGAASTGGALIPLGAALLATSAIVFAGGAFLTLIARATDSGSDHDVLAGDWILMAGATLGAFAALVLAVAGLLAGRASSSQVSPSSTGETEA